MFLSILLSTYKIKWRRISLFFLGGGGTTVLRHLYHNSRSMFQKTTIFLVSRQQRRLDRSIKLSLKTFQVHGLPTQ